MKDEQNNKGKSPDRKRQESTPEVVPGADQTPAVAGPPPGEADVSAPGPTAYRASPSSSTPPASDAGLGVDKPIDAPKAVDRSTPPDIATTADLGKPGSSATNSGEPVVVTPPVNAAPGKHDSPDPGADKSAGKPSGKPSDKSGSAGAAPPPPPRGPAKPQARDGSGGGKALGTLALLVALAALGLSGWQWYQTQNEAAGDSQQDQRLAELAERQDAAQARVQDLSQQLRGLPEADEVQRLQRMAGDLQRSQQALGQRLEALQGESQTDWKLAEAEYMLRLASLRLLAAQDVRSAKALLGAADDILRDQPDSGVFAVREQLAQVLAELETLPEIDRSGIFLRLAALHEQVNRIVALPVPVFDPDEVSVEEEYEDRLARRTRAERVLMRLERYVRVDFQRGKVITPLLDEAEMQRIRRTLQLTIEQAQWAALRGEPEVYRASLERADGMLRQFFELDNPQVRGLQSQLALLADQQVDLQTPDLAPVQRSLAAYVQSLRSGVAGGSGQAPTEADNE